MSISLVLVPVALAMRVVMGKDRFNKWVEASLVRIPTNIDDSEALVLAVRKAGFDIEPWGGLHKTHVRGEEFWLLWERVNGRWNAVFGTSDSRSDIDAFMADLEAKLGAPVFASETRSTTEKQEQPTFFPTNFRDAPLLRDTLIEYGLNPVMQNAGEMVCHANGMTLRFSQESSQPFTLSVSGLRDMRQIYSSLDDINATYQHNVQAKTYEKIQARLANYGFGVLQEEVCDDNSIVLTLLLPG